MRIFRLASLLAVAGFTSIPDVQAQLPAFSGADGAAQFVTGGRGGIVYHVTKLNAELDDNPARTNYGSFQYGLNDGHFPAGVPRTIVFDVAGVFHLGNSNRSDWDSMGYAWDAGSRVSINAKNLTIAGQTAPGPVIIMGGTLKPSGSNIVIRNITIAAGFGMKGFWEPPPKTPPAPGALPTSFTMDAIDVSGKNVMLDHLDAYYTSDEAISCNENAESLTIQYCNSSQGQNYQGHDYGHLLQGGTDFKMSFLHNFDAHHNHRLPRVGSEVGLGALNDFRNNVIYNWLGNGQDAGYSVSPQPSKNNFIQNFYLAGDGGDGSTTTTRAGGTNIFGGAGTPYTSVYANGNLKDLNKDADPYDTASADGNYASSTIQTVAYNINIGLTLDARDAFTNVLRHVGSRWWERDYNFTLGNTNAIDRVDERLIYECITGTGKVVAWADDPFNTNSNEGVEWRSLWALRADTNGVAPFNHPAGWDTDQDGMPDYWELEHGLDPNVANNNGDFDNDGYSNLEEYLNDIAAWPAPGDIIFNGNTNNRYALIHNWQVNGVAVNITNLGTVTTSSKWQPSKYDTAIISNSAVVVDSVGQHAGTLRLAPDAANNATLNITNGWLKVANTLEIAKAGTGTVNLSGGKLRVGTLTNGAGTASFNFTGGTLAADTVAFNLVNQGGILSPGDSPGQTHVVGNLTQQAASSLAIDINGTNSGQFDTVVVDGTATLDGKLIVTFTNGYAPPVGAVFTILTAASITGTFSSFEPSNIVMEIIYTGTTVQIKYDNSGPVLPSISGQVANELTLFSLNAAATDPDVPGQTLTYSLTNSPAGASIDSSGLITWTTTEVDGPMVTNITVLVSDNGSPSLTASRTFQITVNEVNTAPALATISDQVVDEQALLSLNAVATDDDLPPQALTYSLTNSPAGASVDSSGLITWTPTEANGPMVTNITVQVTDNGPPNLTASRTFQVTVNEINTPPTLAALSDRTLNAGAVLNVTNVFSDADLPPNPLSFSLLTAPSGASIDGNGVVTWRPAMALANTTNLITVQLADNGTPNFTTNQSFQVVVNPLGLVTLTPLLRTNGVFVMQISGDVGPDYTVQASTTLTNWSTLSTTNPPATPFNYLDGSALGNRFYRVLLGP